MQWEELTAGDFQKGVKDTGVCVIAMGVIEKHGEHLPPTFTGIRWYSNSPDHYAGDARTASEKKDLLLRELLVDALADYLSAVKTDQVAGSLHREFFDRVRNLSAD